MRKKIILISILLICFLFLIRKTVKAVDISLYQIPSEISFEPFTLIATISGAKAGTNYLRIDLFKDGTNNYFGETFNGKYWYSGSNYQEYFPATIAGSLWTGEIIGRVNKSDITTGSYKIRLRRYTSSSNYDYSLPYDIYFNPPTPTSVIDLTSTPTSSSSDNSLNDGSSLATDKPIFNPVSYKNIYLSEIYPNPLKEENEWVEIYNDNDFSVELINWYLDDIEDGGSSPKKFSINLAAKSYGIIELSSAMFNNDGDSVRLLDFNRNLKDSFEYSLSQPGKSYGRIGFTTDKFCLQVPSKGTKNNDCLSIITESVTPFLNQNISLPSSSLPTEARIINLKKIPPTQNLVIFYEEKNNLNFNPNNDKGEVLGALNQKVKKMNYSVRSKKIAKSLSFLSFSYSTLTLFGVLFKMKRIKKFDF
jgi:hypothetical protein